VLALGLVAAASPVALMYLLVNLYAACVSVYFGGDLDGARLREDFLQPFADFMARGGGLPALYAALTAGAASALTRASGAANTVQGVLLGLVSAVGIQLIGRAFGPFAAWELVAYPLLGVAAGWLGVALSRGALERQEALYRATAALYAVDAPHDVAVAVGENLAGPEEERVTLWRMPARAVGHALDAKATRRTRWTRPRLVLGGGGATLGGRRGAEQAELVSDAKIIPSHLNASSRVRPRASRRGLEDFLRGL
jgi:uncharacterized membrane protein YuzA (DUF378 family)